MHSIIFLNKSVQQIEIAKLFIVIVPLYFEKYTPAIVSVVSGIFVSLPSGIAFKFSATMKAQALIDGTLFRFLHSGDTSVSVSKDILVNNRVLF